MKLSSRLTIATVALVLSVTCVFGIITYVNISELGVPRALERLETRALLDAATLQAVISHAEADLTALRESSSLANFIATHVAGDLKAGEASPQEWRARFAVRFVAELRSKLPYYRIRIIETAGGGKELIRVDREGPDGTVRVASDDDLRLQGDKEEFQQTMKLIVVR